MVSVYGKEIKSDSHLDANNNSSTRSNSYSNYISDQWLQKYHFIHKSHESTPAWQHGSRSCFSPSDGHPYIWGELFMFLFSLMLFRFLVSDILS